MVKGPLGKRRGGQPGKDDIVANLCERCIIGAVCHVKWYEVCAYRLRCPNGGGGDRPRPFIIIAIWAQALCWPRIAGIPLQGLVSAVALVLCIHTGVSELLTHDEWGGVFFPVWKGILCVMRERAGGGCDRPRPFRVIAIRAGFVLAKYRGSTVTSAQVSRCGGLASARRRLPVRIRARCISLFWEKFARLPCSTMFSHADCHNSWSKRRT